MLQICWLVALCSLITLIGLIAPIWVIIITSTVTREEERGHLGAAINTNEQVWEVVKQYWLISQLGNCIESIALSE